MLGLDRFGSHSTYWRTGLLPATFLVTGGLILRETPCGERCAGGRRGQSPAVPGVYGRDHSGRAKLDIPSCRGDFYSLEPDDRERVGHPLTIQQRSPNARVFHIVSNPRTTAATITGLSAASTLTLTGGHVRNGNGGAILVDNPQNVLTLTYVNVVDNSAAQVNVLGVGTQGMAGASIRAGR